MTFSRPTLQTLINRARADIQSLMPGADAYLRESFEDVMVRVLSGQAHTLHGHLLWLSRQIMPDTAEAEFLDRWVGIYGLTRNAAVKSVGPITITGLNATVHPAGSTWQIGDIEYTTDANATIAAGIATPDVTASVAAAAGNADATTPLSIVTPQAGIDSNAVVASGGLVDGLDAEIDTSLLARLLLRIQNPPKGGGPNDYVQAMLAVGSTTRAWEFAAYTGVGTVGLFFVVDNDSGGPIPTGGQVTAMQTAIDLFHPITAAVTVYNLSGVPQAVTLSFTPDTAAARTAIEAQLADLWLRKASPGGTIFLSQINEAISLATGEEDHTLATPAANVTVANGDLSTLGTVTFT